MPDSLTGIPTLEVIEIAKRVGALVIGDSGREMIVQRIMKMVQL